MDGVLRRACESTWVGTLHGYTVHVFTVNGAGYFAVIHPKGYTLINAQAASVADGARRAQEWVERNPLTPA